MDVATQVPTRIGPPVEGEQGDVSTAGYLVVIQHPRRTMLSRRFRIEPGQRLELGRDAARDICVDEETVSRLHCEVLFREEAGVYVRDVNSVNGTFRNGERVSAEGTALVHGDILAVGPFVRLKFLQAENEELVYHEELARLVHCDSLTGATTSGSFLDELNREFGRAKRYGRPLSLILFDVDKFKAINDTWGHGAGDAVLVALARTCAEEVRTEETVGRLGGDEFAILCPETDGESAKLLAQRLCDRIANDPVEQTTRPAVSVACSWGVACLSGDVESADQLRKRADRALYDAKEAGRNRVVLAGDEHAPD